MITLDEFNKERIKQYEDLKRLRDPCPNGIACPECNSELWDSNPSMTLASNPPKKHIHCPDCDYRGYRIA